MTVRPTNCHLTGDQLSISGAVADGVDNTSRDGQCPVPPQPARNLSDELAAADLVRHPARLVLLQDGADDIDFSACLEYQLARVLGVGIGLGNSCVANGSVTPKIATELAHVRASLAQAIEAMAPHSSTIAVLDYYQPIPEPSQIAKDTATGSLHTNLVCSGLKPNAAGTYAAAQVVLGALNGAVAGAVDDARAAPRQERDPGRRGTRLRRSRDLHGRPLGLLGRARPRRHSGRRRGAHSGGQGVLGHGRPARGGGVRVADASARAAERDLQDYVWRAAHPTAAGQRALAVAVERQLSGRL